MQITFDASRAPYGITDIAAPSVLIDWESCNTPKDIIRQNCKRFPKRFIPVDDNVIDAQPVAIVGYGSSLCDTWEELRDYKTIFTCSGAHQFLLKRQLIPTYHGESDPQPHKVHLLGLLNQQTTYLPASICHPLYMDYLQKAGVNVLLWHPFLVDMDMYRQVPKGDYLITSASVVGPRLMRLARLMGYTNLHIYGMDGSGGHAEPHPNKALYDESREVRYNDKTFVINPHLIVHVGTLLDEMNQFPENTKFTFHGDGLVQEMAKGWVRKEPKIYRPLAMVKDE